MVGAERIQAALLGGFLSRPSSLGVTFGGGTVGRRPGVGLGLGGGLPVRPERPPMGCPESPWPAPR